MSDLMGAHGMSEARAYRARDGVQIAAPPERLLLLMRHRSGQEARATSSSFDALLDLREQLARLGYGLVRLERQN